MKILVKIILILCTTLNLFAQENSFKVFIFKDRYTRKEIQYTDTHSSTYDYYNLFSQGYLESRTRKGHIDPLKVKASLLNRYSKNDTGYLVLDFEGEAYQDLLKYKPGHQRFDAAELEFIQMLDIIKRERPNLKIGIYGLPFRFYFSNQKSGNEGYKLDNILKKADFIAPSLYILYSENENKEEKNITFIKDNLDVSFEIAKRIGKPVIPFFWYMVNPINRRYGLEVISKEYMDKYMKTIRTYSSSGTKVSGVFWWEISPKYFREYIDKSAIGMRNKHNLNSRIAIFKYYQLEKK